MESPLLLNRQISTASTASSISSFAEFALTATPEQAGAFMEIGEGLIKAVEADKENYNPHVSTTDVCTCLKDNSTLLLQNCLNFMEDRVCTIHKRSTLESVRRIQKRKNRVPAFKAKKTSSKENTFATLTKLR